MNRIFVFAILVAANSAQADTSLDSRSMDYLEGLWMIGSAPSNSACIDGSDPTYQIEFEFHRTGGRLLHYKPMDVFTALPIADAIDHDGEITITLPSMPGKSDRLLRLREISPDRMQTLPALGAAVSNSAGHESQLLYRCGRPNRRVNETVPLSQLKILTTTAAEWVGFVEAVQGYSDQEICSYKGRRKSGLAREKILDDHDNWLNFDVFGPVHFYIFGTIHEEAWHSRLDLSPIDLITVSDATTLNLRILERLPGANSWIGGERVRPYTLTVQWDGRHISIPEMNRSFVRCRLALDQESIAEPAPVP